MAASGSRVRAQRPRSALVFVEDDGVSATVEQLLLEEHWDVFVVEHVVAARRALDEHAPSVAVLDLGLRVEELERIVVELRAREPSPSIVILSDLATAATIAREHELVFVREPFDLEEFVDAVESARTLQPTRKAAAHG